MAEVTNGYCTPTDLQSRFNLDGDENDPLFINAINAASRWIDKYCARSFFDVVTPAARVFRAKHCDAIEVDDFSTTTGLIVATDSGDNGTYGTTWTVTTDFVVEPANGVVDGLTGVPYHVIRSVGGRRFPVTGRRNRIQVTARWGWAEIPSAVEDACMIQAAHLFRRKDTPDGIAGAADFGVVRVSRFVDPDVEMLLAPYRKVLV
jgi:hypothetical protein